MREVLDFDSPATGWHYKLYKRRRWNRSCRETGAAETVATWYNPTMQNCRLKKRNERNKITPGYIQQIKKTEL